MTKSTKILDIEIHAAPADNFRITKGGKRILTSNPAFKLNIKLTVERIKEFGNIIIVSDKNGTKYLYEEVYNDNTKASLRNVSTNNTSVIDLKYNGMLLLEEKWAVRREGL